MVFIGEIITIGGTTFAISFLGSKINKKRNFTRPPLLERSSCSLNEADESKNSTTSNSQIIRAALAKDFPEIETVYSDAYLESAARVPNRTMEHAISKIKRSLECRRSYEVESLLNAFEAIPANETGGKVFVPRRGSKKGQNTLEPSQQLVEVCASGAFVLLKDELVDSQNSERRLVVYADTSKLNWWEIGVTAGLQYHVMVLEDAFHRITNENKHRGDTTQHQRVLEESLVLCVDTTAPPFLPPPLGALRGMVRLLQKAYPDRIHRVYVGPVSPFVRGLYATGVRPFLKPKLQQKIILLGKAPSEGLPLTTDIATS